MAVTQQKNEGHYFKVLESHKKRLGDYEQVHFRKSVAIADYNYVVPCKEISLAPRRSNKPSIVPFDKNSAATYLRQTETQWLMSDLSRQDAAKLLFNKPIGTFVVRKSQKARYALSLRVPVDDPAVNHFLIQTNQQNFLTIQGSNLPFLSIYDLLAYFCFNRSGGMPCCLNPPVNQMQEESSDSSDSDGEGAVPTTPPKLPPRTDKQKPSHLEEIFINHPKPDKSPLKNLARSNSKSAGNSPMTKRKVPPPKPSRNNIPLDYETFGNKEKFELFKSAQRVDSIVDMELSKLCTIKSPVDSQEREFPLPAGPVPAPTVLSKNISDVQHQERRLLSATSVDSVLSSSPKVMSLIQMFENKSPSSSPPLRRSPTKVEPSPPIPRKRAHQVPLRPPKPQPPPIPPKQLSQGHKDVPTVPPRTPAPTLPPRPASKIISRWSQMVASDNEQSKWTDALAALGDFDLVKTEQDQPPRIQPKPNSPSSRHVYEPIEFLETHHLRNSNLTNQISDDTKDNPSDFIVVENNNEEAPGVNKQSKRKHIHHLPGWAKKLRLPRKPRKRIRKFIIGLSENPSEEFSHKINEFIADMRSRSTEPHQKMLSEIRNFLTQMHEFLITNHKEGLLNSGMESCDNFGHVLETTLQQLILQPLSHYIYLRIEEYYSENGYLFQVQRSIHQGKLKQAEEMGIRKNLVLPGEKVVAELSEVFSRLSGTPCAITKLEYLLEAVRLTYENVRDSKQPKKQMNDLGADDFLPLFVWVLVQCGFYRAEIEAEYMWGLAPPSLFNGEGGYYLTTLTSAVNVLKELTQSPAHKLQTQQLPTMNEMQTELKVYCEDEHTGQYSTAFYLPIVPTMTAAEICETIADRKIIPNPEKYALFKVINGKSTMIGDQERPQEIKLQWTLDKDGTDTLNTSTAYQPSTRFMAYKLRTP